MLEVDQLIKEVDRHKGLIRVEGIVTAVVPDRQMVALVDIEQYKKCGVCYFSHSMDRKGVNFS